MSLDTNQRTTNEITQGVKVDRVEILISSYYDGRITIYEFVNQMLYLIDSDNVEEVINRLPKELRAWIIKEGDKLPTTPKGWDELLFLETFCVTKEGDIKRDEQALKNSLRVGVESLRGHLQAKFYDGYGWIKVRRYKMDQSKTWEEKYKELEQHHIEETTFLIAEVRKLAKK